MSKNTGTTARGAIAAALAISLTLVSAACGTNSSTTTSTTSTGGSTLARTGDAVSNAAPAAIALMGLSAATLALATRRRTRD